MFAADGAFDGDVEAGVFLPAEAQADEVGVHRAKGVGLGIEGEARLLLEVGQEVGEVALGGDEAIVAIAGAGVRRRRLRRVSFEGPKEGFDEAILLLAGRNAPADIDVFALETMMAVIEAEALEEGGEAKFLEVRLEAFEVDAVEFAFLGLELELDVVFEGDEPAGGRNEAAEFLEVLPELGGELVEVIEHGVGLAILLNKLGSRLFPYTRNTRNIVDVVAHQGLDFDRLMRAVAAVGFHPLSVG